MWSGRRWQAQAPSYGLVASTIALVRLRYLAYLLIMGFLLLLVLSEGVAFVFTAWLFLGLMCISVDTKPRLRYLA